MRSSPDSHGFSLIEVNLAILLVAVGLLALFSLFPLGLKESERGMADTQEAMFADTVLSGLEGNAIGMTNWEDWVEIVDFGAEAKKGIEPAYVVEKDGPSKPVTFPGGSRYTIRYKLKIGNANGDGSRKYAELCVMHGRYGDFGLASVYYTEFIYTGM
jgi:hypothetical protein